MMNAIASGGMYHTPFFLECTVDETDGTPLETLAHPQSRRVMSAENAALLRKMLCQVVDCLLYTSAEDAVLCPSDMMLCVISYWVYYLAQNGGRSSSSAAAHSPGKLLK